MHSNLKRDFEDKISKINTELENLEYCNQQERAKLEEYEDMELKKIKRERKEFEKEQREKKGNNTNKRGKQEIEELNSRIAELNAEIKAKDRKNNAAIEKLKEELEFYTQE